MHINQKYRCAIGTYLLILNIKFQTFVSHALPKFARYTLPKNTYFCTYCCKQVFSLKNSNKLFFTKLFAFKRFDCVACCCQPLVAQIYFNLIFLIVHKMLRVCSVNQKISTLCHAAQKIIISTSVKKIIMSNNM